MEYTIHPKNFKDITLLMRKIDYEKSELQKVYSQKAKSIFNEIYALYKDQGLNLKEYPSFALFAYMMKDNETAVALITERQNQNLKQATAKSNNDLRTRDYIFEEVLLHTLNIKHEINENIFSHDNGYLCDAFKNRLKSLSFDIALKNYVVAAIYSYYKNDLSFSTDFYNNLKFRMNNNAFYYKNNLFSVEINSYISILHNAFGNYKDSNNLIKVIENNTSGIEAYKDLKCSDKIALGLAYLSFGDAKWLKY